MHKLNLRSYQEEYKNDVDRRAEEIKQLKSKVDKFEELNKENDKNSQILSRLFEWGVIDEDGELIREDRKHESMEEWSDWFKHKVFISNTNLNDSISITF